MPLGEGVLYPATPRWNLERPFLNGHVLHQEIFNQHLVGNKGVPSDTFSMTDLNRAIGIYAPSVQELLLIDDLLYAMVGIEGKYISFQKGKSKENTWNFQIDPSMDLSLQESAKRLLPLCECYSIVSQFTESRSHFEYGLVNHALAAAFRAILQDYHALVAQLEHQFRLGRLALQGLWFYCQPMMGAMQALTNVVLKASEGSLSGAAILNLLENQAAAIAGDSAARSLLQKLSQFASAPYLGILERWVYEGVIDDPYGEFFIDENKALQKESLSQDLNATYWQQRYSLKHELPGFLSNAAETILTTGKYLNAMRECGHNAKISFSDDMKGLGSGTRHYLERINVAYNFASAELLDLITQKFDLMGRLRSVKHYFLVDQGDLLVHFMDIAKDELAKRPSTISVEKLQSLLDLALRTSIAASDPYNEDLLCNVEKVSLLKQLENLQKMGFGGFAKTQKSEDANSLELSSGQTTSGIITGLETFTLDYKVQWPLTLVISRKALMKYQLIFRLLFHCKHVERQLCGTWQVHQATRGLRFIGTSMPRSYVLCQRMLHFTQTFVHYLTFEVIEPNWHVMHGKLQAVKSIDEVIYQHDYFLDKCLKECVLLWPQIFKKVEKLKAICLQYATATQWLIPSMSAPDLNSSDSAGVKSSNSGTSNRFTRNRYNDDQARTAFNSSDEATFRTTISKIGEEFDKELNKLLLLLTTESQTDPYLAHLAHGLYGVGKDI
ncbi:hypothetical protein KP509_13G015300 [Ceratopteris richardii]|nr:hypothetical protein KP509_13G015300 [Ceratopteris richardii]KAH7420641.1 hypothetical protein KP509_13G015300 [Ceratopteris richardii]